MKKLIVWNEDGSINMYETMKNTKKYEEKLKPRCFSKWLKDKNNA